MIQLCLQVEENHYCFLIKRIKGGKYILVDDDSVTGKTIKNVKEKLPKDVTIEDVYLLANTNTPKIFDVVDLRDFMIGCFNSGLTVKLPNNKCIRVPYVMPYVNLTTRASIPPSREKDFSISIWKLNYDFYKKFNENLKLKEMDSNFIVLMNYIGFSKEDKITDICLWHINKLLNN